MLVIQIFLFQLAVDGQRVGLMVVVGLLMAWLVFLRPVCAALVPVGAFFVFRYWQGGRALRTAVLFLLPFAVLDGVWTFRNWRVNHEFNPLTNEGVMPKYITDGVRYPVETFIQTYGGTLIWSAPAATCAGSASGKAERHWTMKAERRVSSGRVCLCTGIQQGQPDVD